MLPTAVANASDHYIVVARGERPRFMTVEEVARGFGIPAACPLMAMLAAATPLSCNVAVDCLGRSIHVVSATRIVKMLVGRGLLARGLRYGSAYSGIDTFAAAGSCWPDGTVGRRPRARGTSGFGRTNAGEAVARDRKRTARRREALHSGRVGVSRLVLNPHRPHARGEGCVMHPTSISLEAGLGPFAGSERPRPSA